MSKLRVGTTMLVGALGSLLCLDAGTQSNERPDVAGSGNPAVDTSGRLVKNLRVRAVHSAAAAVGTLKWLSGAGGRVRVARVWALAMALWLTGPAVLYSQGETGFLRGAGHLDVIPYWNNDSYDEFWIGDKRVEMADVGEINRITYGLYAAYGVTETLDVSANVPFVSSKSDGTAGFERESDLQDLTLKGKWKAVHDRLGSGSWCVLLAPGIKVPLSSYEDNAVTAIGDGQTDYQAHVILHYQFDNGMFASFESGYDRRAGRTKDEVPYHLTVGANILGRVTVAPFYSRIRSLGGTDIGGGSNFSTNQEEYDRYGVNLFALINDRLGLTASYRWTTNGRNTGDVEGMTVGLVGRF